MGNGASIGQGGNPAHGKQDVREAADTEQHDWSQLAEAPITNTLLATVKSYIGTSINDIAWGFNSLVTSRGTWTL